MRRQTVDIHKQPLLVLLTTLVALLVAQTTRAIEVPHWAERASDILSPLGVWIDGILGGAGVVVSTLSVVVGAVITTRLITRYTLSPVRSFVPLMLFAVGVSGIVFPVGSPAIMLSLLMLVLSTDLMIGSFKRSECFDKVMRGAFWAGLAALVVPDLVYVLILLPFQWLLWQRSPREMAAGAIMALLPLLPASFCWWVAGEEPLWLLEEWCNTLTPLHAPNFEALFESVGGVWSVALGTLLTLLTLVSMVVFASGFNTMRLRARKGHLFFAVLYFVGLFMLLCGSHPAVALPVMGYAMVPLINTLFVKHQGALSAIVYIAMVALGLAVALIPLL